MAATTTEETKTSTIQTYLSFRLDDEVFAANVHKVLNILEMTNITKVPKSPGYMRGVINLRGSVLPVIDLRVKFGMEPTEATIDTCIVVLNIELEDETITLGVLVDAVKEVLEIEEKDIEPAPNIGTKYKAEFIKGMWKKDDGFIMLLNIDTVFTSDELVMVKEADTPEAAQIEEKDEEE